MLFDWITLLFNQCYWLNLGEAGFKQMREVFTVELVQAFNMTKVTIECQEQAIIWIIFQTNFTKKHFLCGVLYCTDFLWITPLKIPKGTLEQSELFRLLHAFNADTQMDKDQQCTSVFYLVQIWFSECNWALGTLIYWALFNIHCFLKRK